MNAVQWGGSEELWAQTALACKNNGHNVLACVYDWEAEPIQVTNLISSGIKIIKFDRPLNRPKRFYRRILENLTGNSYKQRFKNNLKKINAFNPDIICVSQGGTFNVSSNEHLYNFLIEAPIPFVIICQHNFEYAESISKKQAHYEKELFNKAQVILFVAKRNLETAERQLAYKIKNSAVISNPVNLKNNSIKTHVQSDEILKMACVARFDIAFKGQDILLQALSSEIWMMRKYHLEFYGAGPDLEYLNRLINFYNLADNVTLVGHTNDISSIWQNNDLLILPSISEGTPLSLVEAMLCGRPALATDVGDISKYVKNGVTGFLAPVASANCLSIELENVWKNRGNLKKMGERAYQHALSITDLQPELTLSNILIKVAGAFPSSQNDK